MKSTIKKGRIVRHSSGWQGICQGVLTTPAGIGRATVLPIYTTDGIALINQKTITKAADDFVVLPAFFAPGYNEEISTPVPKPPKKQEPRTGIAQSWKFRCDQKNQIDESLLKAELSNVRPLIILKVYNPDIARWRTWAVIHKSISVKARNCGIDIPTRNFIGETSIFDITAEKEEFWVNFCQKVRDAKWKVTENAEVTAFSIFFK